MAIEYRPANEMDGEFLFEMLFEAINWPGHERHSRQEIRRTPGLMRYVEGWPKDGEFGFVAYAPPGHALGAAWTRLSTSKDPGYGYIADDVPEISMAVAAPYRRQGIGRRLLTHVIDEAKRRGLSQLSLSVENLNTASKLYEDAGFKPVGRVGNATTMAINLP